MKAYKGFYKDGDGRIYCSPKNNIKFYYEEGKTYETNKAELCECGFHACTIPIDVFWYYNSKCGEVEFHEVELEDTIDFATVDDSIVCSTKITIGKEITPDEMVELSIPMIMTDKENYFIDNKPYRIHKDNKWNFIDTNGKLLSEQWFDWVYDFHEGFAEVGLNNKGCNFINTDGKIISDEWFDAVCNFKEGLAKVYVKNKGYNFIDKECNLLCSRWIIKGYNKIYVAGKITGLTVTEYRSKFDICKKKLKSLFTNSEIIAPIDLCPDDMGWGDSMEVCLNAIKDCDMVYMMDDWKDSKGATVENIVAKMLNIDIIYEN